MAHCTVGIIDFKELGLDINNWKPGHSPCGVSDTEYEIKYHNYGEEYQLEMMFCSKKYGDDYAFGLFVQIILCLTSELACFP